jgi:GNAT superfamily N-acetyltransferase
MLTNTTIKTVDRYWSSFLGCAQEALSTQQTLVVPHADLSDYHGLFLFLRQGVLVVSVPPHLLDALQPQAVAWSQADGLQEGSLRHLVGETVEQVIGPAFVGYTDRAVFQPRCAPGLRILGPQDGTTFTALQAACSTLKWEHGGSQLSAQPVVGADAGGHLVAVAGYTVWGDVIAHVAVITHPQHRGQGYGRAVVSRLTEEVLCQGLVPQYRTLEANQPSMAIAHALGFVHYATTVAVRLRLDAT